MTVIHGSVERPEAESTHPTRAAELDADLRNLHRLAPDWIATSIDERIHILETIMRDTASVAEDWVRDACEAKQIPFGTPQGAEDWYTGPALTIRNARLFRDALMQIREHGVPQAPGPVGTTRTGQVKVGVFPTDNYDKLMFQGVTGEIWMEPGVTPGNLRSTQAGIYQPDDTSEPRVCFILGAGNVSSIPANDAFTKLFQENQVVILKMNPINEYVGDHLEKALAALINRGFLKIVYGKADVGKYLTTHDLVDTMHITGSDKTYDTIVWGPHEEGDANKAAGTKINSKPITAELGNVSPVIVVPGPWTDREIAFQGEHLAASLVNNAGFNCNATRVIVTHKEWKHREALLDAVGEALLATPGRHPYYPGSVDRWEMFVNGHPEEARTFGESGEDKVPWTLITDIDPSHPNDLCFQTEAFNGVMAEAPLSGDRDVAGFLREAVELCNEKIWGSLNVTILIHPSQSADPLIAAALEDAISDLRYGTIGVNLWAGFGFALMSTTWGAHPGHTPEDIQSGDELVHNPYMFEKAQKSVIYGPFTQPLKPIWFPTSKSTHVAMRQIVALEAAPNPLKLPALIAAAVRS